MGTKNTTPDFGEETNAPREEAMAREDVLLSEKDLLAGLLELGNAKDDSAAFRKVPIYRAGVLKIEFRVRPIFEEEAQSCYKRATRYAPAKPGQPKKAIETDGAKARSLLIYTATIDEDRAKLWDNKKAQEGLNVLTGEDVIEKVLLAGEKDRIIDLIDEISGFNADFEETARD
jgi:hypothetical protein